jgi:hypothetical protein
MVTRISRLLLPLLISFTIGTAIYQGLGPNGALYELLEPFGIIDHALTNPDALGIITEDMTDVRNLWVEIGSFARYCIVPMIITYIATTVIIPGAWLLDDAGVCFYQKALKFLQLICTYVITDQESNREFGNIIRCESILRSNHPHCSVNCFSNCLGNSADVWLNVYDGEELRQERA